MSYEARRAGLLDKELGSASLTLADATLEDLPLSEEVSSMHCEVVVARTGARIVRQSTAGAFVSNPRWDEAMEFRCCLGWDIQFSLVLRSSKGTPITVLCSEVMTIKSARSSSVALRMGAKLVGQLRISLTFSPNYRSFQYLAIGCHESEQLPYTLVNSLLVDLNALDCLDGGGRGQEEREVLSIIAAADNFTTFLTEEDTFTAVLCKALSIPGPAQASRMEGASSSGFGSLACAKVHMPSSVPLHKVATGAKVALADLLGNLRQAPPVTLALIEKQLSIYAECLAVTSDGGVDFDIGGGRCADEALTWNQFAQFCIVSGLWFMQQATAANTLLRTVPDMTLQELDALRFGFSQYDSQLSGSVSSSDLYVLLQDMGEEYSETEIGLTALYLDADNLESIEFSEFVRWWSE